jgi:putative transposase
MQPISYARHRFPPDVIRHAVRLYLRFTLSYRDVDDLLAERGFDVSNESIRRWVLKFGPAIARNLRSANSDASRPGIPISFRPAFRIDVGHHSELKPAT